jgi:hypothetical protein
VGRAWRGDRPRCFGLTAALATVALLGGFGATTPATAKGIDYAPAGKKVFHGVSDTGELADFRRFRQQVRAHPATLQAFHTWGFEIDNARLRWRRGDVRGMLSVSTTDSYAGAEVITPSGIAHGKGDGYPLRLSRDIARWDHPVYIRLLPEMNGYWNPYSAYNADGSFRGRRHSQHWFKQAWRRFTLIVRGGSRRSINQRLRGLDLPPIQHKGPYKGRRIPRMLPQPKVALMWVPAVGSPDVPGNRPGEYWPGRRYVDWVGGDSYSSFPNFGHLTHLLRRFEDRPFVLGEYAPRFSDDAGWVRGLLHWSHEHRRVKMLVYYQGFGDDPGFGGDPNFDIARYPDSRRVLRRRLDQRRWVEYPSDTRSPARGR